MVYGAKNRFNNPSGTTMKIKNKLRTAAEFSISATIIATLLAACGGGGGGTAATTPTSTINVTPGKGKMVGATVTIKNAKGVALGNAPTTTTGIAGVAIPATETGPFIIEVSCLSAACSYYDEKTKLNVPGSATMPALQAVVPGATNTNLGVTAATTAAAQYALNTGAALTPTSIAAANTTVATSLGLPAGTNILTPPTIIANDADYQAAKGRTTAADLLANLSASFAMSASGVTAMQAIADYGNAWKVAATTPASGVIMPGSINKAELTLATSGVGGMTGIPTATIPNVTAAMTTATATVTANITAVNNFLTDMTTTGLREFRPGQQWQNSNASGVPVTQTWYAEGRTSTATLANGVYTIAQTVMELINKVWTAISGTSNNAGTNYVLTTSGWVDEQTLSKSFTTNADGTATTTNMNGVLGNTIFAVSAIDIAGTMSIASAVGFVDANGFGSNINASGVQATPALTGNITFPAGWLKEVSA